MAGGQREGTRITPDYISFSKGWGKKLNMPKSAKQHVGECAVTYMSIGDVKEVFGAAAFVELKLVTYGLLDDDVVGLLRRQNFIDILCRSHSIHLVGLEKNSNKSHSEADFYCLFLTLLHSHFQSSSAG